MLGEKCGIAIDNLMLVKNVGVFVSSGNAHIITKQISEGCAILSFNSIIETIFKQHPF